MYGIFGAIGIGKEAGFGSAVAATDYIEALSESISLDIERFDVVNIHNKLAEPDDLAGMRRIAGDIVFAGNAISMGYFLNSALGVNTISEVASGTIWSNKFTQTGSHHGVDTNCAVPSYTLEIQRDVGSSQQYAGCAVTALSFGLVPNQDLRVTASIIGRTTSVVSQTTVSYPADPANPFTFDTASISLGGSANVNFEEVSVNIDNGLEGVATLDNSTAISKIRRTGSQMVTVGGTLEFSDLTEYTNFLNQTEQAFSIYMTSANSHSVRIDIPRMIYTSFPMGMPGRERLMVGWEGKARYHTGSGTAIAVTLTTVQSGF